jgi:hypothetical protein
MAEDGFLSIGGNTLIQPISRSGEAVRIADPDPIEGVVSVGDFQKNKNTGLFFINERAFKRQYPSF